jgi:hypothetical protein
VRKCGYCDFYSVASREHLIDAYMRALKAELSHARREVGSLSLRSLYLGGGTPTVLSTDLIRVFPAEEEGAPSPVAELVSPLWACGPCRAGARDRQGEPGLDGSSSGPDPSAG